MHLTAISIATVGIKALGGEEKMLTENVIFFGALDQEEFL